MVTFGSRLSSDEISTILGTILTTRGDTFRRGVSAVERIALPANQGVLGSDGTDIVGIGGQFSSHVSRTTAQSIPNVSTTVILFPTADSTEEYDNGGWHDGAVNTGRLTCPSGGAGKYLFVVSAQWQANVTGQRQVQLVHRNSADTTLDAVAINVPANDQNSEQTYMLGSVTFNMAVGDYVLGQVFHNAGVALNLEVGSRVTKISIHQLIAQ